MQVIDQLKKQITPLINQPTMYQNYSTLVNKKKKVLLGVFV